MLFEDGELQEKLRRLIDSLDNRKATENAKAILQKDLDRIESGLELDSYDKYFPMTGRFTTLLDYFQDAAVFFSEYTDMKETLRAQWVQFQEDMKVLLEEGQLCKGLDSYQLSPEMLELSLKEHRCIYLETFATAVLAR